jgi:hypothetical protein
VTRRTKPRVVRHNLGIYRRILYIVYARSDEVDALIRRRWPELAAATPDWCDAAGRVASNPDRGQIIIYICADRYERDLLVGTVAHEASHVVDFIWDEIGGDYLEGSEEPRAYLLGEVAQVIYDVITAK